MCEMGIVLQRATVLLDWSDKERIRSVLRCWSNIGNLQPLASDINELAISIANVDGECSEGHSRVSKMSHVIRACGAVLQESIFLFVRG